MNKTTPALTRLPGILLILLFIYARPSHAQPLIRHNTFSFGVNDGLLQTAMLDVAFDRNNFLWISFTNGIQKFDGKNFIRVPAQEGLPEDKSIYFFVTSKKALFLSHSKGISWYNASRNTFALVYANPKGQTDRPYIIAEDEGILYFLDINGFITGIDTEKFSRVSRFNTGLYFKTIENNAQAKVSDNISGHRICIYSDEKFYLWDLKAGRMIGEADLNSVPHYSANIRMKSPNEIYYFTRKPDLYLNQYDFDTGEKIQLLKGPAISDRTFRSTFFFWKDIPYLSHYNELYQCSKDLKSITGRIVNFSNLAPAEEASIARTREDNFGNLYVFTINKGFRKLQAQNYPIRYYGSSIPENNYFVRVYADKKQNRVLAGGFTNGITVFDTLQQMVKSIPRMPGTNLPFTPTSFLKLANDDYLVFISDQVSPWRLKADLSAFIKHPFETEGDLETATGYCTNPIFINDENAIVLSHGGFYRVNTVTGHTRFILVKELLSNSTLIGSHILMHRTNDLVFIDTSSLSIVRRVPLPNTGGVRCYLPSPDGTVYLGTNKGIFRITATGKVLQQISGRDGLPDECVYTLAWGTNGSLWCSTNRGIVRIGKDGSILQLRKEDGLQENEFNTEGVYESPDGELYFAGINGLTSLYPSAITSFPDSVNVFLTEVKFNDRENPDSAAWELTSVSLPHHRNFISLEFIGMGLNTPEQYIYQYRMNGIERDWIRGNPNQPVRYYLSPGRYRFQLFVSRQFDPQAQPMKELVIVIRPPFWKTWWFISAACILLIALLTMGIQWNTKRKFEKQLQALENERRMKLERERISRDLHDNLGAYANAVIHNSQLLENEQDPGKKEALLSGLRFASRDIITSLRETVWALNREEFTAEDCMMRIHNFLQPLVRYYPNVQFRVSGQAPQGLKLHYTKALNLVRIVQEAISNSIKHAQTEYVHINSTTETGSWTITISDNGKGFDVDAAQKSGQGNGLYNMKSRAHESGFSFIINSTIAGTTITIKL